MLDRTLEDSIVDLVARMIRETRRREPGHVLIETKHEIERLFVSALDRERRDSTGRMAQ